MSEIEVEVSGFTVVPVGPSPPTVVSVPEPGEPTPISVGGRFTYWPWAVGPFPPENPQLYELWVDTSGVMGYGEGGYGA